MPNNGSISITVSLGSAVEQMFDICEDLRAMVDMAPTWRQAEATEAKDRIVNTMASWLDGNAETETVG